MLCTTIFLQIRALVVIFYGLLLWLMAKTIDYSTMLIKLFDEDDNNSDAVAAIDNNIDDNGCWFSDDDDSSISSNSELM